MLRYQSSKKDFYTESADPALLSRHHQCSATRLVYSINRCIVGKQELDTVNVTRERRSMKRSPAGGRGTSEKQRIQQSVNSAAVTTHVLPALRVFASSDV